VPSSGNLGLTLQYTALSTVSTIWHILDVPASSPADIAGLLPYSDYILGTPEGILHGESGLGELVEDHIGRPLRLYVYNNEYDVTREVTIHPSRDWGGEGALGCVLGFGALHRLPAPLSEPVAGPGETLFSTDHEAENARFSNEDVRSGGSGTSENFFAPVATGNETAEFLVPAQIITPPPPSGGPPSAKKDKRHGHGTGHGKLPKGDKLMDDYFKEGEKKSREVDFAPSAKNTPPPPPPKSKGPPPPKAGGNAAAPPKADDTGNQSGID
jgi:GRASP55/65 PDZ-like domain